MCIRSRAHHKFQVITCEIQVQRARISIESATSLEGRYLSSEGGYYFLLPFFLPPFFLPPFFLPPFFFPPSFFLTFFFAILVLLSVTPGLHHCSKTPGYHIGYPAASLSKECKKPPVILLGDKAHQQSTCKMAATFR